MRKPNFFLLGAPKCGTTSMAEWLSDHPRIYFSPIKEPNFFNTDDRWTTTQSLREYESLYRGAGREHLAIGEGSVWYLFSQTAVRNILSYTDDVRFIVMLRNPVEMAYLLHQQEVFSGNEHVTDFMQAWNLQERRADGQEISSFTVEPRRLQYGPACSLGEQLARLYEQVPEERVLVLLLDDVKHDARREYLKALAFLGVPNDGRVEFPVINAAKAHRSRAFGRIVAAVGRTTRRIKLTLGIHGGMGFLNTFANADRIQQVRPALDQEDRETLCAFFMHDVERLSTLLQRDLTGWLESSVTTAKEGCD